MFMNVPRRLGRSPFTGPQSPTQTWRYPIDTDYQGAVVGRDGTVYMGSNLGQFLALRPDGSLKWSITVPGGIAATPAVLGDGRIAFLSEGFGSGGTIYVVNPNGSPSWKFRTGEVCNCPQASPAIGPDGTIYFGLWETAYALTPSGSLKWSFHIPGPSNRVSEPVSVGPDGVVYLPSNYLYALNPDGTVKWHSVDELAVAGSPAVADDGTIYVHTHDPNPTVWAFNPDGAVKWTYNIAVGCCSISIMPSIAIGADGTVYDGETIYQDGQVGVEVALNPDGTLKWEAQYGTWPTSAAIGADGTIYFGSGTHTPTSVYALNPDGTLKWEFDDEPGYIRTPPAIGKGQRLYVGNADALVAIGP